MINQGYKKIIAFDFDQTLSVVHLFKSLSGWGNSFIPGPHGSSEYGHVQKIFECNEYEWKYDQKTNLPQFLNNKIANQQQFSSAVLGGIERVNILQNFFQQYTQKHNCQIIVITRGYVGTVNKIMNDVGLNQYITGVYGNIEFSYGKNEYDEKAFKQQENSQYIIGKKSELSSSKGSFLKQISENQKLTSQDSILVDDDKNEIEDAQKYKCFGLHVKERKGVTEKQLQMILDWIEKK